MSAHSSSSRSFDILVQSEQVAWLQESLISAKMEWQSIIFLILLFKEVSRVTGWGLELMPDKIVDSSILLQLLRKKRSPELESCVEDIKSRVNKKIYESDPSGSFDTMRLLALTEEKKLYREILVRRYYSGKLEESINSALGITLDGDTVYSCSNGSKIYLRLANMAYWYQRDNPAQFDLRKPSSRQPMPGSTAEQLPIAGGPSIQEPLPRFTAEQLDNAAKNIIERLAHHYNEDPKAIAATINQNTVALAQRKDGSVILAENFIRFKDHANNFANAQKCTSAACSYGMKSEYKPIIDQVLQETLQIGIDQVKIVEPKPFQDNVRNQNRQTEAAVEAAPNKNGRAVQAAAGRAANVEETRKFHAEQQILQYADNDPDNPVVSIGINKKACASCHDAIVGKGVTYGYGQPGTTPPSYYVRHDDDDADTIATFNTGETELRQRLADENNNQVRPTVDGEGSHQANPTVNDESGNQARPTVDESSIQGRPNVEDDNGNPASPIVSDEDSYQVRPPVIDDADEGGHQARPTFNDENGNQAKTSVGSRVKEHFTSLVRPSVGIDASSVLDFIENVDKGGSAHAATVSSYSGTYEKERTLRWGGYAGASVASAGASHGAFGASARALSADAHYEYGLHNSAGASLTVARAEANVGPIKAGVGLNFDTGASAGIDGVGFNVLGFGLHLGPKPSIKLPFVDLSCSIM